MESKACNVSFDIDVASCFLAFMSIPYLLLNKVVCVCAFAQMLGLPWGSFVGVVSMIIR